LQMGDGLGGASDVGLLQVRSHSLFNGGGSL
jgi:hypothetical protein